MARIVMANWVVMARVSIAGWSQSTGCGKDGFGQLDITCVEGACGGLGKAGGIQGSPKEGWVGQGWVLGPDPPENPCQPSRVTREAPDGSTGCLGLWVAGVPALELLGHSLEDEVGWWESRAEGI